MIDALLHIFVFVVDVIILALAIIVVVAAIIALASKGGGKQSYQLKITNLNDIYQTLKETMRAQRTSRRDKKQLKKEKKQRKNKPTLYVLDFQGDIRASQVESLRAEISAILTAQQKGDEVLLRLESGGGVIHGYGLAASQLQRLKAADIPLTIAIDKIAASGGYLMACIADKLIAAPFAIIGSIGVLAQLPNFNKLLKKHDIEFEQITAGEYKRTLTVFGENTDKAREKMKADIDEAHTLFKDFVKTHRPQLDMAAVATGEYWFGQQALHLKLVDHLQTSDDYILKQLAKTEIRHLQYKIKRPLLKRLGSTAQATLDRLLTRKTSELT